LSQTPLIIAWLLYFLVHSLIASTAMKQMVQTRFPRLFPWYRLGFNLIAAVSVLIPFWMMYLQPGNVLWQWQGSMLWLMNVIALTGVIGFLISTKYYDNGAFLGIKPNLNNHIGSADEPLVISPMHRYIRHPWYFFGLLIIWTRDMNTAWLISCIMMTAYFLLGSKLEENKLIKEYGDGYAEYRNKVGGIIPLPWRILSEHDADRIIQSAKTNA
jgi:protein-S-isoprenylcysteine O-methyltransferase Ste14